MRNSDNGDFSYGFAINLKSLKAWEISQDCSYSHLKAETLGSWKVVQICQNQYNTYFMVALSAQFWSQKVEIKDRKLRYSFLRTAFWDWALCFIVFNATFPFLKPDISISWWCLGAWISSLEMYFVKKKN